jgi:MYXO-CTERM domain-containing protein
MRRSGSTCERRWPISTGPRIRLALMAAVLLAVVGTARADWDVQTVQGLPNDVEVWTPDTYSVSTQINAVLMNTDGGVRDTHPAPSVGTFYAPATSCFVSFQPGGGVVKNPANCVLSTNILPQVPGELRRVKHTEAGNAYAWGYVPDTLEVQFLFATGGASKPGPWSPELPVRPVETGPRNSTLGVLSLNNEEHAVFGVKPSTFYWYRGQQLEPTIVIPPGFGSALTLAADVFPTGLSPTALLGTGVGMFRIPLLPGGPGTVSEVPLPGPPASVTSIDVNAEAGSPYGAGFGMALRNENGSTVVLRAVPATNPQSIGTEWKVSTLQPALPVAPVQVECLGAQVCVATVNRDSAQNVAIYRNVSAPVITVGPGTSIPESSTGELFVGAADTDGDPVRLTVERLDGGVPPDGGPSPLSFVAADVAGGVKLTLTSLPVCEDMDVPVQAVASDGWRAHDTRTAWNFRVIHTAGPAAPVLSPNGLIVQAGREAGVISVTGPALPRCRIDRYYWSALSPNAERLDTNGGTASFPTPTVLCEQNGRTYFYRVQSIDEGGALSAPTDFNVQVRPWGMPSAAFGPDAGVGIDAGQTVTLVPAAEHLCQTSPGYPGVDTRWELAGGQPLPEKIQLTTAGGAPVLGTSAVTPRLVVTTQECVGAELTFLVRHYTKDGSGIEGPPSTVKVSVDPRWAPVSTGTLELNPDPAKVTAQTVGGKSAVTNLNCLPQRGNSVKANIRLERPDGTVVRQGEFTAPGDWGFVLDQSCGPAATYHVVGQLLDVSGAGIGGEGSVSAQALTQVTVEVPSGAAPLDPLYEPRITARCGEAARGTLRQRLPSGPCEALPLTWEQIGGPPLTQSTFSGSRIDVTTQESDFGALIGQPVVMRVSASTVGLQREHTVPITAEPFVEVSRRTERPTGADTELLGVTVDLHNTTACGVREVNHVERLEGVDYVPGSARFNGAQVEAELHGSELTVRGLMLEGDARGVLTYVVRPRLLGPRRFEGQSLLRGIPISQPPEPLASGCGCSGGGSGAIVLGLAGLLGVLSRRRRRS